MKKDNDIKRFRKGMKLTIEGIVRYRQDFSGWEGSFPNVVFTLEDFHSEGYLWLAAPGYGERGNYGNGKILISKEYKNKMKKSRFI